MEKDASQFGNPEFRDMSGGILVLLLLLLLPSLLAL